MSVEQEPLITRLIDFKQSNNRAALANLRRSLSFAPGTWPKAFQYVESVPKLGEGWRREVAYLVAGLFALAQGEPGSGNLGESMKRFARTTDSKSVEQRFIALLEADRDELPHRLRQIVTLLKSGGVGIHWDRLYSDLRQWNHPDKYIQQAWARSFYAYNSNQEQS